MTKTIANAAPSAPAPAAGAPKAPAAAPAPAAAATEPKQPAPAAAADADATPAAKAAAVPALGAEETDEVPALGTDDAEGDEPAADGSDAAADGDAAADASDGDESAPMDYEFEAPEGAAPYREPVIAAYKTVLQKHKVDPAVAKDILETVLPAIQADVDSQTKQHIETTKTAWREELQQRHGNKLGEVRRLANRALAKAASPELRAFLRDSVLAENPDFNDLLAFFGQRITNDRSVKATESAPKQPLDPVEEAAAEYDRNAAQRGH